MLEATGVAQTHETTQIEDRSIYLWLPLDAFVGFFSLMGLFETLFIIDSLNKVGSSASATLGKMGFDLMQGYTSIAVGYFSIISAVPLIAVKGLWIYSNGEELVAHSFCSVVATVGLSLAHLTAWEAFSGPDGPTLPFDINLAIISTTAWLWSLSAFVSCLLTNPTQHQQK